MENNILIEKREQNLFLEKREQKKEEKFKKLFLKNLTEEQKIESQILFDCFKNEDWKLLINTWKKTSSLLRYNNIKKIFDNLANTYKISITNYNSILIGLQYYIDKTTNSSKTNL